MDTLNKEAVKKFLEITHERCEVLGEEFSKSVPAIFTDEPQFVFKQNLADPYSSQEVGIPFTDTFEESFKQRFKASFSTAYLRSSGSLRITGFRASGTCIMNI